MKRNVAWKASAVGGALLLLAALAAGGDTKKSNPTTNVKPPPRNLGGPKLIMKTAAVSPASPTTLSPIDFVITIKNEGLNASADGEIFWLDCKTAAPATCPTGQRTLPVIGPGKTYESHSKTPKAWPKGEYEVFATFNLLSTDNYAKVKFKVSPPALEIPQKPPPGRQP